MSDLSLYQAVVAGFCTLVFYISLRLAIRKPYEGYPFVGHLFSYGVWDRQYQAEWTLRAIKYHENKSFPISIPGVISSAIVVSDPACLKHIWVTQSSKFNKAGFFADKMEDLIGQGILSATGDIWKAQRHAGMTFSTPDTLAVVTNKTLPNHLPPLVNYLEIAADQDEIVDLRHVITDFIFKVFGEIGFDATWEELQPLSEVFDVAAEAISFRFEKPGWPLWERILPYGRHLQSDLKIIRQQGEAIVRNVIRQMKEEELGGKVADPEKGLLIRNLIKEGLDEKIIVDSMLNFTMAGRDTTAHAIIWGIYQLITHPSVVESLVHAIDDLPSDLPFSEAVQKLPILDDIVNETMRLHPSIPFDLVQLGPNQDPVPLPDGTVIQPNDIVYWVSWAITRLPDFFGPDAEEFRPERWNELPRKPTPYEMPTFHAGPRSCVGQQMARLETAYVLLEIFRRFELIQEWQGAKELDEGLAGEIKGGLKVRVRRRQKIG